MLRLRRICVEAQCGYGFNIGHFGRNEISFRVIEYHVNTFRNEMPTHVHQSTGSFWNANETACEQNLFSRRFGISNRYEFISPLMWTYPNIKGKVIRSIFSIGFCYIVRKIRQITFLLYDVTDLLTTGKKADNSTSNTLRVALLTRYGGKVGTTLK